jgi:acyl-CoA synthetase (AMP-forming)/AMP-acid ligase II
MSNRDLHIQEDIMTEPQSGISYSALIVEALTRHRERAAFIQEDRSVSYAEAADKTSRIRAVLERKGSTKPRSTDGRRDVSC